MAKAVKIVTVSISDLGDQEEGEKKLGNLLTDGWQIVNVTYLPARERPAPGGRITRPAEHLVVMLQHSDAHEAEFLAQNWEANARDKEE